MTKRSPFKYLKTSSVIIRLAVMLYVRFFRARLLPAGNLTTVPRRPPRVGNLWNLLPHTLKNIV